MTAIIIILLVLLLAVVMLIAVIVDMRIELNELRKEIESRQPGDERPVRDFIETIYKLKAN